MNEYLTNNKLFVNQTKRYLVPLMRVHGSGYVTKMSALTKLGIGYNDYATRNMDALKDGYNIFFLVNSKTVNFIPILQWFRKQDYYVLDYEFDDIRKGNRHMIVLKFPEEYNYAYDYFLEGKYSKMLNEEEVKGMVLQVENRKIFNKTKDAIKHFATKIQKDYDVEIDTDNWDGEADYPPMKQQEIFNYDRQAI